MTVLRTNEKASITVQAERGMENVVWGAFLKVRKISPKKPFS